MAKIIQPQDVEAVVRKYLADRHFELSRAKEYGQTGADVIAYQGDSTYFIEVIGFQDRPPIRSREFYECFFRAVSRDRGKDDDMLIMALPVRFKNGMGQRKHQYPVAWDKIGATFPNLRIWYVDTEHGAIEERSWCDPIGL